MPTDMTPQALHSLPRYSCSAISPHQGQAEKIHQRKTVSWAFRCRRNTILFLLVAQITLSALLMRYSRTSRRDDSGPKFRASVVVLATEALKLPICLVMTIITVGGPRRLGEVLRAELPTYSTLKCALPAFAYTLQGNLLFVATANLETPTFQVTYQTKTLFTALFSVIILGRRLVASQWAALLLLFCGTVAATDLGSSGSSSSGGHPGQLGGAHSSHVAGGSSYPNRTSAAEAAKENPLLGLVAVLIAALLSSSSSVYFEMMLKHVSGLPWPSEAFRLLLTPSDAFRLLLTLSDAC